MNDIAFVTVCKGRLHHIKKTLPTLMAASPSELIVVDYACPQGVGSWVESEYPDVKVVRVSDDSGFCLPRARNVGAANTKSSWICFIDGDIQVTDDFAKWLQNNIDERYFYRASLINGRRDKESWGTVVCHRDAFNAVGGYDEIFRGWGGEDDDLYTHFGRLGLTERSYPHELVQPISHDNDERVTFHEIKDIKIQGLINKNYSKAKYGMMDISNQKGPLPFELRTQIMEDIKNVTLDLASKIKKPRLKVRVDITNGGKLTKLLDEIFYAEKFTYTMVTLHGGTYADIAC